MVRVMTPPLLLLLGLLGLLCAVGAIPPGHSPFQWFQVQHVRPNPVPCDQAMIAVSRPNGVCKQRNTFLHDALQNVINVCRQGPTPCENGQNNCHQSARPVRMTDCRLLRRSQFPDCHYTGTPIIRNFTVACNPPHRDDPQDPLVPVHFDRVI